jgi:hypothetical protein
MSMTQQKWECFIKELEGKDMLTETMFTLGRRYAIAGQNEQDKIIKDVLGRMNHWIEKEGEESVTLFSCFVEGARSTERDDPLIRI